MDTLPIVYEPFPAPEVGRFIGESIVNLGFAATGHGEWFPVGFFLKNLRGEYLGGITGYVWGGWLHVRFLWVATTLRGQRYGTRLMDAAEDFAREHGCMHATLETFSYQAPGFYRKRGYEVVGQLVDYPPGHTKYFLRKSLRAD